MIANPRLSIPRKIVTENRSSARLLTQRCVAANDRERDEETSGRETREKKKEETTLNVRVCTCIYLGMRELLWNGGREITAKLAGELLSHDIVNDELYSYYVCKSTVKQIRARCRGTICTPDVRALFDHDDRTRKLGKVSGDDVPRVGVERHD